VFRIMSALFYFVLSLGFQRVAASAAAGHTR